MVFDSRWIIQSHISVAVFSEEDVVRFSDTGSFLMKSSYRSRKFYMDEGGKTCYGAFTERTKSPGEAISQER